MSNVVTVKIIDSFYSLQDPIVEVDIPDHVIAAVDRLHAGVFKFGHNSQVIRLFDQVWRKKSDETTYNKHMKTPVRIVEFILEP